MHACLPNVCYLCVCALCDLAQVVLCSGGDAAKEDLLGHSASQSHAHPVQELLFSVQILFLRKILSIAQAFTPGNNGHLEHNDKTVQ